jgi:hypothetical protein
MRLSVFLKTPYDCNGRTATTILSAVEETMSKFGATSVTTVGHFLGKLRSDMPPMTVHPLSRSGCALALLDGVYLPLRLSAGTSVTTTAMGVLECVHFSFECAETVAGR